MIVTHAGWLSIELNGKTFGNGQIEKQIYEHEDDVAISGKYKCNVKRTSIYFLLFAYLILLYPS